MTHLMDLVAGETGEILLAIGVGDLAALDDSRRFAAHVALGGGLDPTWLDLFAESGRSADLRASGLEAETCPGRPTRRLDELDQDPVTGTRMNERHWAFRAATWRAVDQLETRDLELEQRLGEVGDLETDVVEALPLRSQEARDAGRL